MVLLSSIIILSASHLMQRLLFNQYSFLCVNHIIKYVSNWCKLLLIITHLFIIFPSSVCIQHINQMSTSSTVMMPLSFNKRDSNSTTDGLEIKNFHYFRHCTIGETKWIGKNKEAPWTKMQTSWHIHKIDTNECNKCKNSNNSQGFI